MLWYLFCWMQERAFRLWCWYFLAREEYERKVCTGMVTEGGALPATPEQREQVVRNAALLAGFLRAAEVRLGITSQASDAGRERANALRTNLTELRRQAEAPFESSAPPRGV
jgi:hypothetical protein